jgi:large subunit ribosomal protein L9
VSVVFLEDYQQIGFVGEEVAVKPGFARNFLVPAQRAVYATPENQSNYIVQRTVRGLRS